MLTQTDVINNLIRREREREEKFQTLKAAIEEGLSNGISEDSVPEIMQRVEKRMARYRVQIKADLDIDKIYAFRISRRYR